MMKRGLQGTYRVTKTGGETVKAFVPFPLPPSPAVAWTATLQELFGRAHRGLGRLDGAAERLPDVSLYLYTCIRKEAVLSSMIEGTQSSLADLLIYEAAHQPGVPLADVEEVSRYVAALNHGIQRLGEGFPLSLRLIREMHAILLSGGRGSRQTPGEFRQSQNWIGGSRPGNAVYVPPPVEELQDCLGQWELFLHDLPVATPPLLKAALAHLQFETIHPFLDGNGRLGRLIITLLLCEGNLLRQPLLYLSLYFKVHRQYYYDLLNRVRMDGVWEEWLAFFAEAVIQTTEQAVDVIHRLDELIRGDGGLIDGLGRPAESAQRVFRELCRQPIATPGMLVERTGLTAATVNKSLLHLEQLGIVAELTGGRRNRLFGYRKFIAVLEEDTEL